MPDTPLRAITIPAVLPPIACFAAAAAALGLHQEQRPLSPRQLLGAAGLASVVIGGLTLGLLGARLATSDAAWLARPAALVAVAMTAGVVVSAACQRGISGPARRLARLGLATMAVGAVNAWGILAQALGGFALPAAPLLAVQAATMGFLLQIPIHAPRPVVPDGPGGQPGEAGPRRSVVDIVSRTWFAEDPSEDGVLPRRLRRPAIVYVAVTAPILGLVGLLIEGRSAFLIAWVYASAVYTTPAMVVTWAASRRTQYQVTAWRFWFLGVVALYVDRAGLLFVAGCPTAGSSTWRSWRWCRAWRCSGWPPSP